MIDKDFVIGINCAICDSDGKQSLLINEDNLLSALSIQQWYEDSRSLSAALLRSLCIGHAFQDGNKRTACLVAAYIEPFTCTMQEAEQIVLDIATGKLKDVEIIKIRLYGDK